MAFDPVPLAIGGGAVHTDDVWRVAANAFSRDSQGIILPGHLKVSANGTPNNSVNIATGGVVIRNAQQSGQSYVGRAATTTAEARGLTAAGYHLIVARIIDPDFAPWQPSGTPGQPNTSVANGPYFEPHVVNGVSSTTRLASDVLSYSAEALALIENPSGSSTITNAMIRDLRRLAQPRIGFAYDVQRGAMPVNNLLTSETSFHHWPLNSISVYVPPWATHAQASVSLLNVYHDRDPGDFEGRVWFGGLTGVSNFFDWDGSPWQPSTAISTTPYITYGEFDVTGLRGQTVTMRPDVRRVFTQNTGAIWMEDRSQVIFDVRFSERIV